MVFPFLRGREENKYERRKSANKHTTMGAVVGWHDHFSSFDDNASFLCRFSPPLLLPFFSDREN